MRKPVIVCMKGEHVATSECGQETWLQEWYHAVYDNIAVPLHTVAADNLVTKQ